MEINKRKIGTKKYVRIVLEKDEYANSLNCVEAKRLNPLPGDKEIDIGDKLYISLEAEIAKKLGKELVASAEKESL